MGCHSIACVCAYEVGMRATAREVRNVSTKFSFPFPPLYADLSVHHTRFRVYQCGTVRPPYPVHPTWKVAPPTGVAIFYTGVPVRCIGSAPPYAKLGSGLVRPEEYVLIGVASPPAQPC